VKIEPENARRRPRHSGPPTLAAYRAAAAVTPVGAPSETTARAVWNIVSAALPGAPAKIATHHLPRLTEPEAGHAELTAMKALVVAIDTCICAGRDRRNLYINTVFDAIARIWSPTFRATNGATTWEKTEPTVVDARRELLAAGITFDEVWRAVRSGLPDLYTTRGIGGSRHRRGARVNVHTRSDLFRAYTAIMRDERQYQRPRPKLRLLRADQQTPSLKVAKKTIGERDYDVMYVGEATKQVIRILERTRLFLNVREVRRDWRHLRARVKSHPWLRTEREWHRTNRRVAMSKTAYEKARKAFLAEHRVMRKEYNALNGRYAQVAAVVRAIRPHRQYARNGEMEIKTAYYKTRTRRFQPRHLWPTAVSSKEDVRRRIVFPARDISIQVDPPNGPRPADAVLGRLPASSWRVLGEPAWYERTSPRGRWFRTHASGLDLERDDWPVVDAYAGDRRPLVGVDMSSSMYQIVAVVLGWRKTERMLRSVDFKGGIVAAMRALAARGMYTLPDATDEQLRAGVGTIVNVSYGATLRSILKTLANDEEKYGSRWGTSTNLQALLDEGAKIDDALGTVAQMRDEYLTTAQAVAAAASRRSPYNGIRFSDFFDGELVRWHRPGTRRRWLSHGPTTLGIAAPIGTENNGDYPVNYVGVPYTPGGKFLNTRHCLQNLVAPGLIHALDAAFASHVILKLDAIGVRDIVMVHDCFLVPSDAWPALAEAIEGAAEPWFRGLGPFYEVFEDYLGDDDKHAETVRRWRQAWLARLDEAESGEKWPKFRFKEEVTVSLITSGKEGTKP